MLGTDYKNDLLLRQKSSRYWDASGDKYYDTAVALLALRSDDAEKTNTLDWLGENQGTDGCWQGSTKNTAFLLYSISPRASASSGNDSVSSPSCEPDNGYCMSSIDCSTAGGSALNAYQCSFGVCCSAQKKILTCAEQGGEICGSGETCTGGRITEASDSRFACCVDGSCVSSEGPAENTCQTSFGTCRSFECVSGEQIDNSLSCDSSSQVCCVQKPASKTYLWIWVLVILIVLVVLAIIFRNKLGGFWFRIKSTFSKPSGPSGGSSRPSYFGVPVRRMIPRRILPHPAPSHRPAPARRHSGELDDVLKKLKDMSR